MVHRSRLYLSILALVLPVVSACSKIPNGNFTPIERTQTGAKAPDGKTFTGASDDVEIETVKSELTGDTGKVEALPIADRDLAMKIQGARIEPSADTLRVQLWLREDGRLIFDFKISGVEPKLTSDAIGDLRFKALAAKGPNGESLPFELDMVCRRTNLTAESKDLTSGCRTARLNLKNTYGAGAKAVVIVEAQPILVVAKSPGELKHATLKRLVSKLKTAQPGILQSFVVAWGPSGFAANFGDPQICPAGRLVETHDLDEPLRMNCPGEPDFIDLDGRLFGNTTKGGLFIEVTAAVPGVIYGENNEHIYILIRKKKEPKAVAPPKTTTSPATPPTTPDAKNPAVPPSPGTAVDDEEDDDDLVEEPTPDSTQVTVSSGSSWLFPVDPNGPYTKTWARDRKHKVIVAGMNEWVRGGRLRAFVRNFQPNRDLVINGLAVSRVPPEFLLVTAFESEFFIKENYPIQVSGPGALGPWQFMPKTAALRTIGLRVYPATRSGKTWVSNPCDERAHLGRSSVAAGRLFRALLDMFPNDPRLALMAYNMGDPGVRNRITRLKADRSPDRIRQIKELGLGYWTIRSAGIAPLETIEYVPKFVSAYHAILEMAPVPLDTSVKPWAPNPKCI